MPKNHVYLLQQVDIPENVPTDRNNVRLFPFRDRSDLIIDPIQTDGR